MTRINLKAKPFYLSDEQIKWVEDTIKEMSLEEKIQQLFIVLNLDRSPNSIENLINKYKLGGLRWQGGTKEEVYEQNLRFQKASKIPMLIAANCEAGGAKMLKEGTLVCPPAACGASLNDQAAYRMGKVGGIEAASIGCNWTFAPVSDVVLNWRNTIVNTRAFGNDPDKIISCCKAYMRGMKESNIACCTKHFPGDGVEERDQHLVMGCNDLSYEEWNKTFGKVYRALFEEGIESVMVGHICFPSYERKINPSIKDEEIKPATLSKVILTDLLRNELGFNGLVLTDASHMAGMTTKAPRSEQVPGAIAAGCDMFLYYADPEEDMKYMMDGYKNGIISEERLEEALERILGLKAKQGLNHLVFPDKKGIEVVGCQKHLDMASECAEETITLVKDTQHILPIDITKKNRVKLYFVETAPVSSLDGADKTKKIVVEELERVGFKVTTNQDYYEMELEKPDPMNKIKIMKMESANELKENYDLVMMFVHMEGYAQENNVRVKWSASHSNEIPWFVSEVPTICVSLSYTNHLIDLPMMKTYINAYAPTREYIKKTIEKIIGKSEFKGKANDLVWCGRWDTRI